MKKEENKKRIIIGVLIGIIGVLSILLVLFATGIINFEQKESIDNTSDKIDIEILSIDNVNIEEDSPNHKMSVGGTMKLSFNQDKFIAVVLAGYCIGTNDEKYIMTGPGSGAISFNDGDTNFWLVNTINNQTGDVIYSDGTTKKSSEINWQNVKIKSCTVERMIAYTLESNGNTSIVSELNFEKKFETNTNINSYKEYKAYDEVTLSDGSKWMVIENSSKDSDYVSLIKKEGIGYETNTYDLLADEFYNQTTTYENSKLKKHVESLVDKIPANLKEVNGYKIRLISVEEIMELDNNWGYDEIHDDYTYNGNSSHISTFVGLTMTNPKCKEGKCSAFYVVDADYNDNQVTTYYIGHWNPGLPPIKPVINVYKTELEK